MAIRTVPATPASSSSATSAYHVEDPHEYHFILDEACQQTKPFLVLMVPVAPYLRAARDAIRSTWGTERLVLGKVVSLPVGTAQWRRGRYAPRAGAAGEQSYGNLLQSDFKDSYKNLTIKTMVMMEWLSSRCPDASYAMKIDSDMFLYVYNLVHLLLTAPQHDYMTGHVVTSGSVVRDPNSKWYLPETVFPGLYYPPYAQGLGYVMYLDLPRKLVEAPRHVKAIYIEDVYLGLCMEHLDIQPTDPPSNELFQSFLPPNACLLSSVIPTILNSPQELLDTWQQHDLVC